MSFAISRSIRKYAVVLLGVLVVVIPALVFFGRRGYDERLLRCDSLVNSDPAAGAEMFFALVDSGYTPSCSGDRALCALVEAKSCIKNRLEYNGDSLLAVAAEYFNRQNDRIHFAESKLYQGRSHYNSSRYRDALLCGLTAVDAAKSIPDSLTTARAYDLIADVYGRTHFHIEEYRYRSQAADYFKGTNEINHLYAILAIAQSYFSMGDYVQSIAILDSICSEIGKSDDYLKILHRSIYSYPFFYQGDLSKAKDVILSLKTLDSEYVYDSEEREKLVEIYVKENNLDSAYYYMPSDTSTLEDRVASLSSKVKIALFEKDYESAVGLQDSMFWIANQIMEDILHQNFNEVQSDYQKAKLSKEKEHARSLKKRSLFTIGLSILVIITLLGGGYLYIRKRNTKSDARMEELSCEIRRFEVEFNQNKYNLLKSHQLLATAQGNIEKKELEMKNLKSFTTSLLEDHFKTLDSLCKEYAEKKDSPALRNSIVKDVEAEIHKMTTAKSKNELEKLLNQGKNNIMFNLQEEFPSLSKSDIEFLLWNFAGFSAKTICFFCGMTSTNYYTKRRRLREKFAASNAPHKDLYIENLR